MIEYGSDRIEFVKTQCVIQRSENIFQICIDCIVHDDIFLKVVFSLCSGMSCEKFHLLCCFAFTELKCLCALPTLICLLPNN